MTSIPSRTESKPHVDIDSIVRRVLDELRKRTTDGNSPAEDAFTFDQQVIALDDLTQISKPTKSIRIPSGTVVTPAARDELRQLGIAVVRGAASGGNSKPQNDRRLFPVHLRHDETVDAELFASIKRQVTVRGVRLCDQAGVTALLSARPASAVHRYVTDGHVAASVNRIDDVVRFKNELNPAIYVLDVHHLSLMSLVHVIVQMGDKK